MTLEMMWQKFCKLIYLSKLHYVLFLDILLYAPQ